MNVASALNTRTVVDHHTAVTYLIARRTELIDAAEATTTLAEQMHDRGDYTAARDLLWEARDILAQANHLDTRTHHLFTFVN